MDTFIEINAQSAWKKAQNNAAIIVDIRDYPHYNHSHPKTAFHLTNQNYEDFLNHYDYDTHIMVICYHGVSSRSIAQGLIEQGFENIYSISGGFDAWEKAQLPIETQLDQKTN